MSVIWKTIDGKEFEVSQEIALKSQLTQSCESSVVHLNDECKSSALSQILSYLEKGEENLDEEFSQLDFESHIDIIKATYVLGLNELWELSCRKMGDRLRNKSVRQLKEEFGFDSNFTEEEEASFRSMTFE